MKQVKFLSTSAGTYGVANEGDELVLKNSVAEQLEKQGTVKILGDAADDEEESVAPKGSVRITKAPQQGGAPAQETDEKNPTQEKAAPKKAAKKSSKK